MFSDLDDFTAFGGGAAGYDMARSVSSSTNLGTISPSELQLSDQLLSAPNSTAITALTSPSIYDVSPELSDNFDVSPNFGASDWDPNPENWASLFPDSGNADKPVAVDYSPQSDDIDIEQAASAHRRKSSHVSFKDTGRHSLVSGVNARKRDKPLPPIVVKDPNDTVAMKRARNTLAARKSRQRKAAKMEECEETIEQLEAEIKRLKEERDYWKKEALSRGANDSYL